MQPRSTYGSTRREKKGPMIHLIDQSLVATLVFQTHYQGRNLGNFQLRHSRVPYNTAIIILIFLACRIYARYSAGTWFIIMFDLLWMACSSHIPWLLELMKLVMVLPVSLGLCYHLECQCLDPATKQLRNHSTSGSLAQHLLNTYINDPPSAM